MRLLYVCGTYCPSYGGAEISGHTLLKSLKKALEINPRVLTDKRYTGGRIRGHYGGIPLYGSTHEHRAENLRLLIEDFKPDCILTQLLWSDVALRVAKEKNIPSILRVCKTPFSLDISLSSKYAPTSIISVSESVQKYVQNNWQRTSRVIPPAIDNLQVIGSCTNHFDSKYITMFNPIEKKGGKIFHSVCEALPEEKFAVVPGWDVLKTEKGDFDPQIIQRMCESLGVVYNGQQPTQVDFSNLPNVTTLCPTLEVGRIYDQTRVLCVPSIWEEAYGRVAIEGFMNGIPVLGSNVGGLKENLAKGGITIQDYKNPLAWVSEIRQLTDKKKYVVVMNRELDYIKRSYDLHDIVSQLHQALVETIGK